MWITKDKIAAEKKVHQLTESIQYLESKLKKIEAGKGRQDALQRNRKNQEREGSLDINEFISMNFAKVSSDEPGGAKKSNLVKRSRH